MSMTSKFGISIRAGLLPKQRSAVTTAENTVKVENTKTFLLVFLKISSIVKSNPAMGALKATAIPAPADEPMKYLLFSLDSLRS